MKAEVMGPLSAQTEVQAKQMPDGRIKVEFLHAPYGGSSIIVDGIAAPHHQPAKETMLEQLADLLKKYDVRKYLNLNDSGYSQVERDIVDLFAGNHPSVSNPVVKELKQIRDAFQWTFDNMGTPHTSDHFNVPANGIEQLDNLISLFTSQHGEQETLWKEAMHYFFGDLTEELSCQIDGGKALSEVMKHYHITPKNKQQ